MARTAYKLLSAIADYREMEKNPPEGVDALLDEVTDKLHGAAGSKPSGDNESPKEDGDENPFAKAKKGAAEKFRADSDQ